MTDHLDLLVAMGCRVMVFAEGHGSTDSNPAAPLSARPVLSDAEWPAFCEKLNEVARHLRRRGVRLAFHHHMGTVVQTEAEVDRLMASTNDDVGLLLDTGHLAFAGGDPVAVARRHGARIVHVHCKDVRAAVLTDVLRDDRSFLRAVLDGVFTVPGDGSIDFTAVLARAAARGLRGLARRRSRAGSGGCASAHVCADGLRESVADRRRRRVRDRGALTSSSAMEIRMLQFCLVGAGFIGPVHAANIAAHPAARLAWVVDLDAAAGEKLARQYEARATTKLEEALADPAVGAVLICTPPRTHAAIIERAARAGKAVFCEKPVDLDLDRVDACAKVVAAAGTPFHVGFNRRYDPSHRALFDAIRAGKSAGRKCWY